MEITFEHYAELQQLCFKYKARIAELEAELAEANGLRPEVIWFAGRMEKKLKKNDHKGGWSEDMLPYLGKRFGEEVNEFIDAMYSNNAEGTINEAADVANFAMMIADILAKRKGAE